MNAGKYKSLIGAVTVLCLIAAPAIAAASTPISNLRLSQAGDFIELDVVGGGNTLCDQTTVRAANGHPFRIVLDFCDADHALTQLNFGTLPTTRIKDIRTSQYSVSPKHIVRVVLDMTDKATYSVNSEGSHLIVRIVDPSRAPFTAWEANPSDLQRPAGNQPPTLAEEQKAETQTESAKAPPSQPVGSDDAVVAAETPAAKPVPKEATAEVVVKPSPATPMPAGDAAPAADKKLTVATVEEAATPEQSVAPGKAPFEPPPVPLVYAPDNGENETPQAETRAAGESSDITVSKVSMNPIGPKASAGEDAAAAQNKAKQSLWASTTPSKVPTSSEAQQGDGDAAVPGDDNTEQTPETLLERLKTKFFGNQVPPRPYTTVDQNLPADVAGDSTTATADMDREALLERIQRTKQRVAEGTYDAGEGGAGGVPTRAVLYYDDMGRRDPFQPLVSGLRSGFMTDALPDVETLRLVGVLHDDHEPLALLENLEGFSYVMRVGDKVSTGSLVAIQGKRALFRVEEYGWSHVIALQLTPRGSDPSKTLGMGPREYPTHDDESDETDTQGSSEE